MKMNNKERHHSILILTLLIALAATNALADKWKANILTNLNLAASWTNNSVPGGTEFGVWSSIVTAPNTTNSLGADMTWGGIKILDPGGPIWLTASNTLTLNGVSSIGVDMSAATVDLTLNCGVDLAASQTWTVATNRTLTVGGVVGGTGAPTKSGFGTLILGGNNTFSGSVTISQGPLWLKHSNALGIGPKTVTCSNGTHGNCKLHLDGTGGNLTLASGIDFLTSNSAGGGTVYNEGGDNVINGNFTLTSGGGSTIFMVNAGSLTLNGNISANTSGRIAIFGGPGNSIVNGVLSDGTGGSMGFIMRGTGTATFNATNTYTGVTEVIASTLLVNGSLAAASVVTVKTNATLGGQGLIRGPVTVEAGGTLAPGVSIGVLTVSNTLSLAGTALMEINRTNTPNSDRVAGMTTVTYGGTLTVSNLGPALQAGDTFTLFTATNYTGAFAVTNLPALPLPCLCWTNKLAVDGTIAVGVVRPVMTGVFTNNKLDVSWPVSYVGSGWTLESNTVNLGERTNWFPIAGSGTTNRAIMTIDPAKRKVFYRLHYLP